jgi:polyhydroxybutyrate depolymerase
VHGVEQSYWMAPAPQHHALLLLVLHGLGLDGPHMAAWTGLTARGTEAGFATMFPDAWNEMWDNAGLGRSDGIDDAAFIAALVDRLVSDGVAREGVLFLASLSNGAFFAERLARNGLVAPTGIVLVAVLFS